jgi:hypothetical protein
MAARLKNERLETPDELSSPGVTGSISWVVFINHLLGGIA